MSHLRDSSQIPDHLEHEIREFIIELHKIIMPLMHSHAPSVSITALMFVFVEMICRQHNFEPIDITMEISTLCTAMQGNAFNIIAAKQAGKDESESPTD